MTSSETISILAIGISLVALMISYFTFRREKKKANQDLLFQEKINAYKEISYSGNKFFGEFFDLVNNVQFYEGKPENWEKEFLNFSGDYYGKAFEFENTVAKHLVVLPNNIYEVCSEFSFVLTQFVTTSAHCNSEIIGEGYEKLAVKLETLIELIRYDLNIDKLNLELSKRIK